MRRWIVFCGLALILALLHAPGPAFAASADVRVTKTVSGGSPPGNNFAPGDNITYTITIQNTGPDIATNLHVQDILPPDTTFVSLTGALGTKTTPAPGTNGTVSIEVPGNHASGAGTSWTLTVRIDCFTPGGTTITNTVTGSSDTPDANPANNSASVQAFVLNAPCTPVTPSVPPTGTTDIGVRLDKCVSCACDIVPGSLPNQCRQCAQSMTCFATQCGHPADKFGFAAGGSFNLPLDSVQSPSGFPRVFIPGVDSNCDDLLQTNDDLSRLIQELHRQTALVLPDSPLAAFPSLMSSLASLGEPFLGAPSLQFSIPSSGAPSFPDSVFLQQEDFQFAAPEGLRFADSSPIKRLDLAYLYLKLPDRAPNNPSAPGSNAVFGINGVVGPPLLFNPYVITVQNFGPNVSDVILDLTPAQQAALQSLFEPNTTVNLESSVMARVAPAAAATLAAPASVSMAITASAPAPGGKLKFVVTGLAPGQQVGIPVMTVVATAIPDTRVVFGMAVSSSAGDTNSANNLALLVNQIDVLGSPAQPSKPVPPQIFQNPGAIQAVQQRPPRTPTPTPLPPR